MTQENICAKYILRMYVNDLIKSLPYMTNKNIFKKKKGRGRVERSFSTPSSSWSGTSVEEVPRTELPICREQVSGQAKDGKGHLTDGEAGAKSGQEHSGSQGCEDKCHKSCVPQTLRPPR